jgi:hypothetical protein
MFYDEFKRLLPEAGIEFDEKFFVTELHIQPIRVVTSRDSLTLGLSPEARRILALRAFERHMCGRKNKCVI